MRFTRADLAGMAVLFLVALVGVALLPSLPDRFAVHFGVDGADSFVSPAVGVVLLPSVGIATVAFVRLVAAASEDDLPTAFGLLLAVFLAYVQGVVLAWNLGYSVNVTVAVLPAAAVFTVLAVALSLAATRG